MGMGGEDGGGLTSRGEDAADVVIGGLLIPQLAGEIVPKYLQETTMRLESGPFSEPATTAGMVHVIVALHQNSLPEWC